MIKKIFTPLMLFLMFFGFINLVNAGIDDAFRVDDESNLTTAADTMGYDTDKNDINPVIEVIIRIALSFLGVIFIATLIYGGYLWMTSRGNEQQFEKSKNLIKAAIIGLCIVAAAYAISWYVIDVLSKNTLNN
ncbi:pilin [bacterium]|nr:pilin [bacterium]